MSVKDSTRMIFIFQSNDLLVVYFRRKHLVDKSLSIFSDILFIHFAARIIQITKKIKCKEYYYILQSSKKRSFLIQMFEKFLIIIKSYINYNLKSRFIIIRVLEEWEFWHYFLGTDINSKARYRDTYRSNVHIWENIFKSISQWIKKTRLISSLFIIFSCDSNYTKFLHGSEFYKM